MPVISAETNPLPEAPPLRPEVAALSPIFAISQFTGIAPEILMKAIDGQFIMDQGKETSFAGVGGGKTPQPWMGTLEDPRAYLNNRGVREIYSPIPAEALRAMERGGCPLLSAIVNTRATAVKSFAKVSKHAEEPGFRIVTKDAAHKPTSKEKDEIQYLQQWIMETGRRDFPGHEEREDRFPEVAEMAVREWYTIDRFPVELRRDRGGKLVDYRVLDGATIRRVLSSGFRGNKSDIRPDAFTIMDTDWQRREYNMRMDMIPNPRNIAFVQMRQGQIVGAWDRQNMIFSTLQKRVDERFRGEGYSRAEQSLNAITAFMFSLLYNSNQFRSGSLPKIALAFKNGNQSRQSLAALQDEWRSNFTGANPWNIPILNGDVAALDLYKSARDMEMGKYMESMGGLICAVYLIDPAEMGLRYGQSQNILSENAGARSEFSKSRGLNDTLMTLQSWLNTLLDRLDVADKYDLEFTGIEPEDAEKRQTLRKGEVSTFKLVDEVRAEADMEPLPDGMGQVLLDPTWMQWKQTQAQQAAPAQQGAGTGEEAPPEDADDETMPDDTFEKLFKANVDTRNVRTLWR